MVLKTQVLRSTSCHSLGLWWARVDGEAERLGVCSWHKGQHKGERVRSLVFPGGVNFHMEVPPGHRLQGRLRAG